MKTNERDEQGGEQKTMKNNANRLGFKLNEFVVYPAHGVGQIVAIEEQEVAGFQLELFVISFVKDKMTLQGADCQGDRARHAKIADPDDGEEIARYPHRPRPDQADDVVASRAGIRGEDQFGRLIAIAEVVRDLFRSDAQPEQSYSERQLYEAALDRMAREIAAVQKLRRSRR